MSDRFYLPAATSMLVNDHIARCKNLSLILDKYPTQSVITESKNKSPWIQALVQENHIDSALTQAAYSRWHAMMSATKATLFNASLNWRMVIGLGGETVLETDITLHPLYGIPFIPGSALKGLTRAYAAGEYKEYYVPVDKPEEQRGASKKIDDDHSEIKRIFGSQDEAGSILFFDAMPLNGKVEFVVDIMNPHYPEYYNSLKNNKTTPPTNEQQPNPITFLTVANTTFTFALAPRNPNDDQHKTDVELVKGWLQEALQKYGVGGKTSAGYGYFNKEVSSTEPSRLEKTQEPVVQTPKERIRPKLPQFREGQEIRGSVVPLTNELRRRIPSDTNAVLRYESFSTTEVLLVVSAEEAQNWKPGETRICLFVHEEERDGSIVLVCQPRPGKKKRE
jgi:CRISPR type III-B/RAMP module RAMP protein Cmr6